MPSHASAGRHQGVVTDWNDGRGFGFITPTTGGRRLFVHVSDFAHGPRPIRGAKVTYVESVDHNGRACAAAVTYVTALPRMRAGRGGVLPVAAVVAGFFALLGVLVTIDRLPVTLLGAYVVLSLAAFVVYGADKAAAEQGSWRTPESTLLLIGLAGGWPGAVVAQRHFRHKTRKRPFRDVFWVTVVANVSALAWFVLQGAGWGP